MSLFDELQKEKIKTVGELITQLYQYDKTTPLYAESADSGGYDVVRRPYAVIVPYENGIIIVHQEYEYHELVREGKLTYREACILNEEAEDE